MLKKGIHKLLFDSILYRHWYISSEDLLGYICIDEPLCAFCVQKMPHPVLRSPELLIFAF